MADRFERVLSTILTAAAVVGAAALVHNAFIPTSTKVRVSEHQAPDSVTDWKELTAAGPVIGDSGAEVKVVEFGDYECPFCRAFDQQFRAVQKRFPNDIALVFINFPLSIHRFAMPAARASACASAQGVFVRMHELLYEKQDSFGLKSWPDYARDAGIRDSVKFAKCVQRGDSLRTVAIGKRLGGELDVNATPTIIVNGWRLPNPVTDTTLIGIITEVKNGRSVRAAVRGR